MREIMRKESEGTEGETDPAELGLRKKSVILKIVSDSVDPVDLVVEIRLMCVRVEACSLNM
jgi:hypothetical protein